MDHSEGGRSIIRGALGSAITQGVGVATGLQKKFDWAGVAAAGIGAGVGHVVGNALGVRSFKVDRSFGNVAATALTGGARAIANAATRSLVNGTDFGDNILAALPDAIGQTIGDFFADSITNPDTVKGRAERLVRNAQDSGVLSAPQAKLLFGSPLPMLLAASFALDPALVGTPLDQLKLAATAKMDGALKVLSSNGVVTGLRLQTHSEPERQGGSEGHA